MQVGLRNKAKTVSRSLAFEDWILSIQSLSP